MNTKTKPSAAVTARFYLEVEYDLLPDQDEVKDLVERARENGEIIKAELRIIKDAVVDLS